MCLHINKLANIYSGDFDSEDVISLWFVVSHIFLFSVGITLIYFRYTDNLTLRLLLPGHGGLGHCDHDGDGGGGPLGLPSKPHRQGRD